MANDIVCRPATPDDVPALRKIMRLAIEQLQSGYLSAAEIAASHAVMGIDTQLIADGTYFVAVADGDIVGCGGWSHRATLYGGDHSADLREPRLVDPSSESARVRAMYTHPRFVRRGVGRAILEASERAAAAEGFRTAELMATMAGEPFYTACGYQPVEFTSAIVDGVAVPLVRMREPLAQRRA